MKLKEIDMSDNGSLDKLSSAFDATFEADDAAAIAEIKGELDLIEEKKQKLVEQSQDLMLMDQDYIRDGLKTLIIGSANVIDKLQCDIKIGTAPRVYEVYARLIDSATAQYRELRELNRDIATVSIEKGKFNVGNMGSGDAISLKPEQLIDLIESAKEQSQVNKIDADFKIEDDKENKDK